MRAIRLRKNADGPDADGIHHHQSSKRHDLRQRHAQPLARIEQHRTKAVKGFSTQYGIARLVHFEVFEEMPTAIAREKQLKNWKREWKIALIEKGNPDWRDLAVDFGFAPMDARQPFRIDSGSSPE